MKENDIKVNDVTSVYLHDAFYYADDYLGTVPVPELINTKSAVFSGMLKHIYINVFSPLPGGNGNQTSRIDYTDLNGLQFIWDRIFSVLCSRYGKRRTLLRFSIMTGIHYDTLNTWKRGEYRADAKRQAMVKQWLRECESDLFDGATEESNVGCIFGLKSCYQYRETAPITTDQIASPNRPVLSAEEIANELLTD